MKIYRLSSEYCSTDRDIIDGFVLYIIKQFERARKREQKKD